MNILSLLKKPRLFIPIILVVFLGIVALLLSWRNGQQDVRSKAAADSAIFSFSPETITTTDIENGFDVSVLLNTGNQAVVGADILVDFDKTKLMLTTITKPAIVHPTFKTYAPIDTNGNFDTDKVITTANATGTVEFGILSFDYAGQTTTPAFTGVISPVITLRFIARTGSSGTTTIQYKWDGSTSTTDSNVVISLPDGDPEDILAAPTSTVAVNIGTTGAFPTPQASPSTSPSTNPIPAPTVTMSCQGTEPIATISWDRSNTQTGSGYWIDINDQDALFNFTNGYWNKSITTNNVTTTTAPTGFNPVGGKTNPLIFNSGTTYYIRIFYRSENIHSIIGSFTGITCTNEPHPSPSASPSTMPSPSDLNNTQLFLKIKFQGISQQRPNRTIQVYLTPANGSATHISDVSVNSDVNGIYSNSTPIIVPVGTYKIIVDGPTHLSKKLADALILTAGTTTQDFSGDKILTGDAFDNDRVDIFDYNKLVGNFGARYNPATGAAADFDFNNVVNIFDYNYLVGNFDKRGDQ